MTVRDQLELRNELLRLQETHRQHQLDASLGLGALIDICVRQQYIIDRLLAVTPMAQERQ